TAAKRLIEVDAIETEAACRRRNVGSRRCRCYDACARGQNEGAFVPTVDSAAGAGMQEPFGEASLQVVGLGRVLRVDGANEVYGDGVTFRARKRAACLGRR